MQRILIGVLQHACTVNSTQKSYQSALCKFAQYIQWFLLSYASYVTEHEKLMCTKCTCSNFARYLLLCICYDKFVRFTKFLILFCLTDENYSTFKYMELLTIKVWKIGQISCIHKLYFLMLSHICLSLLTLPFIAATAAAYHRMLVPCDLFNGYPILHNW